MAGEKLRIKAHLIGLATAAAFVVVFPSTPAAAAPTCNGQPATIVGTGGNDTLNGTSGDDVIVGLGGADTIRGGGGNDVICGGAGGDRIIAGRGADTVLGQRGNDLLLGGPGKDDIRGGGGNDEMRGGSGDDTLVGDGGDDLADGQYGTDDCTAEQERNCEEVSTGGPFAGVPDPRGTLQSETSDGGTACRNYTTTATPFAAVRNFVPALEQAGWTMGNVFSTGYRYDDTASVSGSNGGRSMAVTAVGSGNFRSSLSVCITGG